MDFYLESNPNELLLGFYFCDGETDDGQLVKIYSLGFIFITLNFQIYR